jgi:NAD(P)H-hydrate epimerase
MKLLNTQQIRQADAYTIEQEGISSYALMERAAQCCTDWMLNHLGYMRKFVVVCGPGNNGGDGLAIARQLQSRGLEVDVFLLKAEKYSADNLANQRALEAKEIPLHTLNEDAVQNRTDVDVVWIDALLGNGGRAITDKHLCEIIDALNSAKGMRISIDLPSGLQGDSIPESKSSIVKAKITLCFHKPRLSFFFEESAPFLGHWEVLDIGLREPESISTNCYYTTHDDAKLLMRKRPIFSHKGTFGHTLIAGGSLGMAGAAILASKAALRSGAGKVTAFIPKCAVTPLQSALPEAMCLPADNEIHLSGMLNPEHFDAIAFGMGIGTHEDTARLFKVLIQNSPVPMVLDADALNILAEEKTWLAFLPARTILTPHPGELDRLCGKVSNSFERWQNAQNLALKTGCIVVLKGAYSRICLPNGQTFFNSSGNAGMATAGAGDVLSGIIAALLASGYSELQAAVFGVFAHGMAGDYAASQKGQTALIAGDIIEALPQVWKELER